MLHVYLVLVNEGSLLSTYSVWHTAAAFIVQHFAWAQVHRQFLTKHAYIMRIPHAGMDCPSDKSTTSNIWTSTENDTNASSINNSSDHTRFIPYKPWTCVSDSTTNAIISFFVALNRVLLPHAVVPLQISHQRRQFLHQSVHVLFDCLVLYCKVRALCRFPAHASLGGVVLVASCRLAHTRQSKAMSIDEMYNNVTFSRRSNETKNNYILFVQFCNNCKIRE